MFVEDIIAKSLYQSYVWELFDLVGLILPLLTVIFNTNSTDTGDHSLVFLHPRGIV